MRDRILLFLTAIDDALAAVAEGKTLDIYHIGRSAIVWEYDYIATTSDFDFLQPKGGRELVDLALSLFGKGTRNANAIGLYLDEVHMGLPPAPAGYDKRAHRVEGPWRILRVYHLEPHDLAATKLKRFLPKDRQDIRHLCDLGLLDELKLEETLEKAFYYTLEKDGDEFRDAAFRNLRVVQQYLRGEIAEF